MVAYDKPKRKNTASPPLSVWNFISSLVSSFVYYSLVVPTRWTWRQSVRLLQWSWRQTKQVVGFSWQLTGTILIGSWHIINTIARNTIFTPFIFIGRLLGFIPNSVPKGLSAIESEAYQRINRQFRRQKRWYLHILTFLVGMATLWIPMILSNGAYYYPTVDIIVTLSVIWLVALGGHRLWMNLGDSEDHRIGEALHHIRKSQRAVYYEEEIYDELPYDASRLEETDFDNEEWVDDEENQQIFKAKR
jgi:hypothetical protein